MIDLIHYTTSQDSPPTSSLLCIETKPLFQGIFARHFRGKFTLSRIFVNYCFKFELELLDAIQEGDK